MRLFVGKERIGRNRRIRREVCLVSSNGRLKGGGGGLLLWGRRGRGSHRGSLDEIGRRRLRGSQGGGWRGRSHVLGGIWCRWGERGWIRGCLR